LRGDILGYTDRELRTTALLRDVGWGYLSCYLDYR